MAVFALWLASAWSETPRAATARADGLLRDEGARLFTLLHRIDVLPAVGLMPNGDVLLTGASRRLWRLGLNGQYELIGTLPGYVDDVGGETSTTILTLPSGTRRVERYDLTTGQSGIVADITDPAGRGLTRLVVLDDGSVVVTDGDFAWRVRSDSVARVLAGKANSGSIGSLAALPGGAFAYVDTNRDAVVRVGRDGQRRILLRLREVGDGLVLASARDQLVVIRTSDRFDSESRTQILRIHAGRIREKVTQRLDPPVYGNGDGYGPPGMAVTGPGLFGERRKPARG